MKKYIPIVLISALTLSMGAGQASADDEALYALGGFIGGVITTKAFDHHRDHHRERVVCVETPRYSKKHYRHGHKKHRCDRGCSHYAQPSGYYKTVEVRKWVPGCWRVRYDRCGNRVREWEPGYHTYVTERVWVENKHRGYARR